MLRPGQRLGLRVGGVAELVRRPAHPSTMSAAASGRTVSTRDAVGWETPASIATSVSVTGRPLAVPGGAGAPGVFSASEAVPRPGAVPRPVAVSVGAAPRPVDVLARLVDVPARPDPAAGARAAASEEPALAPTIPTSCRPCRHTAGRSTHPASQIRNAHAIGIARLAVANR